MTDTTSQVAIAVCAAEPELLERARQLSQELKLPFVDVRTSEIGDLQYEFLLTVTSDRLELHQCGVAHNRERPIRVDWLERDIKSNAGRTTRQPLARSLGLGRRRSVQTINVLDVTAGYGYDAWLAASLGCRVAAIERIPAVFAIARDAWERAHTVKPDVTVRIALLNNQAGDILEQLHNQKHAPELLMHVWDGAARPHVVYLDPMFPAGRKTAEAKPLRILREVVGSDPDADALLPLALQVALMRVVVKRPRRAPVLAGIAPTISHAGKGVRYDVYAVADARLQHILDEIEASQRDAANE